MKLQLLFNRVLVRPIRTDKTDGGLYLPATKKNTGESIVMGVSEDLKVDVKVGDKVMHQKWEGVDVKQDNGEVWKILEAKHLLAVL